MTGIILMGLGSLVFVSGLYIYRKTPTQIPVQDNSAALEQMNHAIELAITDGVLTQREEQKIRKLAGLHHLNPEEYIQQAKDQLTNNPSASETELINQVKKKGDDFEKYVVQKFSRKYYTVIEWAGDKYVNGIYAESTLKPDLLMKLQVNNVEERFYVECKWRQGFNNNSIEFASPSQFERYKALEENEKIPVFIALGVGGDPKKPDHLYTLPLRYLNSNIVSTQQIERYAKDTSETYFFVYKSNILK